MENSETDAHNRCSVDLVSGRESRVEIIAVRDIRLRLVTQTGGTQQLLRKLPVCLYERCEPSIDKPELTEALW